MMNRRFPVAMDSMVALLMLAACAPLPLHQSLGDVQVSIATEVALNYIPCAPA